MVQVAVGDALVLYQAGSDQCNGGAQAGPMDSVVSSSRRQCSTLLEEYGVVRRQVVPVTCLRNGIGETWLACLHHTGSSSRALTRYVCCNRIHVHSVME